MGKTYSVTDLDGCAEMMRKSAIQELGGINESADSYDNYISIGQVKGLLRQHSVGIDEQNNIIINDKVFNTVYDAMCGIITGVGLARLASEGLVNVSFNNDTREFEFISAKDHKTTKKKSRKNKNPDVDKDDE